MTDYKIYTTQKFEHEGGSHIKSNAKKYECYPDITNHHGYTDESFARLCGKIAELYKEGDTIRTINRPSISNNGMEIILEEPLSSDDLKTLATSIADGLWKKRE